MFTLERTKKEFALTAFNVHHPLPNVIESRCIVSEMKHRDEETDITSQDYVRLIHSIQRTDHITDNSVFFANMFRKKLHLF
jgi:hypothetical protein